jgi:hypothetical protein
MGPERPWEPQGGRGERQSAAEGGEGAGNTVRRETHKKKKLKGFEGFCRRGFAGGVLASQALLLPVQEYLTPGTALL